MTYSEDEINDWLADRIEKWSVTGLEDTTELLEWLGWSEEDYKEWFWGGTPEIAIEQFIAFKDNNAI